MAVHAIGDYKFPPRDSVDTFAGMQLLYASWDHHLLFASPFLLFVSPDENLGDVIEQKFKPLLEPDPDTAEIDWTKVTWLKANAPWQPDMAKSVSENGLGHKAEIRLQTPGLSTLVPTGE